MESGMRNGHGTTYFKNGAMEYEGQWLKNMPDGQNCIIYGKTGKVIYEGRLVRGVGIEGDQIIYEYGKSRQSMVGRYVTRAMATR